MSEEEWRAPCPNCGCEVLKITHLGFFGGADHYFRMNVVNGKKLDADPCDAVIADLT